MDSEHFPDLHEFYEILEVIVCGARNERQPETKDGQPEDLGDDFYRTPLSMPGKLNPPLSSTELSQFFDNTFFSSLIEMDYHGQSMGRILCHVSYECLARSQYVVYHMLSLFKSSTTNKLPIFSRLLYPLLFIHDSLQARRIHWLLSPFKLGFSHSIISSASTGVLGILRNEERQGVYIIHFLMHSMLHSRDTQPPLPQKQEPQFPEDVAVPAGTDPAAEATGISVEGTLEEANTVYKYLLNKRADLYWMKDFLAGKLDNDTTPKTIMDDEVDTAEADIREHFPGPHSTVTPRQLYVVVSKLVDQAAAGTSSLWEREEGEYMRKIESLQNELRKIVSDNASIKHKMQNVRQYYRQKVPAIPPPESDCDDQNWVIVERDTVGLMGTQLVNTLRVKSESGSYSLDNAELGKGMPSVLGHSLGSGSRSTLDMSTAGSADSSGREDSGPDGHRTPRSKGTTLGGPGRDTIQRRKSESDIDPDQYPKQMITERFFDETNGTTTSTTTITTVPTAAEAAYNRPPEAEVVDAKARSLLEVFGHLPLDVIKLALSYVSWNPERAANNLFDDDNVKNYTKEVEERKKYSPSSLGPERPGKSGKDMDLAEP